MHTEQCPYCHKHVAEKPILGTMHFCLSPEERNRIDMAMRQVEAQKQFVERYKFGALRDIASGLLED
jgi:hypothetical protein